jgi:hypothetical protein
MKGARDLVKGMVLGGNAWVDAEVDAEVDADP